MSMTGTFQQGLHHLLFTGDDADDHLTVSRDLAGHLLGNGQAVGASTVDNTNLILVNAGAGDDVIALDETNGLLPAAQLSGGAGTDPRTGGRGNAILGGQDGTDSLFGGAGNDTLIGGDGNDFVDGDQGSDTAFLGGGNDVFRWDNGDGSDRVDGGSGFDEMLFNGNTLAVAEQFTLSAGGHGALFTRAQGNIVMDLSSVEHVAVNTFGGTDTLTINELSGSGIKDVDVNLGFDGSADTLNINDDDNVTLVNNGNGNLTILGVSGATVHVTGFEAGSDHLSINGHLII